MNKSTQVLKRGFLAFLCLPAISFAQVNIPNVEAVYGGRILDISTAAITSDTTRVFLSTESANSIFYNDVPKTAANAADFGTFSVVPGVDENAGFGSGIQNIAAHQASGKVFFQHFGAGILRANMDGTVDSVYSGNASAMALKGDTLVYLDGANFHFGILDADGNFTENVNSPKAASGANGFVTIEYGENGGLYIFVKGNSPTLLLCSDNIGSLGNTTTFSALTLGISASAQWTAAGVAPDGRVFIGGSNGGNKTFAYSDDNFSTAATEYVESGFSGVGGNNFAFSDYGSGYNVYFAKGYNFSNGTAGSWGTFGSSGFETHPNDGAVSVDPNNSTTIYLTTDQGIGASVDSGLSIFEINDGVEAVQVNDFDMDSSKVMAWMASKSGVRKASNFNISTTYTNAIFPNNDGSPYYSADINPGDTNVVYVGNVRVYKSTDDGATWMQKFTAEDAPYSFSNVGSQVKAIEVCHFDTNVVMVGYNDNDSSVFGGLFVSNDAGENWEQILLHESAIGQDADVQDIVFNIESGDTVAYVGVNYIATPGNPYSIYRVVKSGSTWTPSQDMVPANTSTGAVIGVTINDIHVSSTGDTLVATGTDAGANHPVSYYKVVSGDNKWTPYASSGYPSHRLKGYATTLNKDTVYIAADNDVYYYTSSMSGWALLYSYPEGTRINFLYYDDLLVGTGTGLFQHFGTPIPVNIAPKESVENSSNKINVKVFPNPTQGWVNLAWNGLSDENLMVSVIDVTGRELKSISTKQIAGNNTLKVDLEKLPNGIFTITLKSNTSEFSTVLIKN